MNKQILVALVVAITLVAAVAIVLTHAFDPPDTSCDERVDALNALRVCLHEKSCLISLPDVERLERLERHCPTLPSG